ncbi:MAG: RNA methyltransferase, partial [Clostridia bacterium]|nr:RNA methyltransferase [Clostridia bacterium]
QKATELGATRITPFESSRCIKRPGAEKQDKITARLARIAEEAAKQCGRSRLPEVDRTVSFDGALSLAAESDLVLFCYEGEGTRHIREILCACPAAPASVAVLVGSEGGFSPEEAAAARAAGFAMTGLGRRILRCETAPVYALSALAFLYES